MMTKKILIFIPYLTGGGAQRVVVNLLKGLAKKNYDLVLVVVSKEGPFLDKIPGKVKNIELSHNRTLLSVNELKNVYKREKPDVILSALNYANIVSVLAYKLARIKSKVIVTEHSNYSNSIRAESIIKKLVYMVLIKKTYKHADTIIAVSEGVGYDLKEALGLKTNDYNFHVIYNPIVDEEITEKQNGKAELQKLGNNRVVLGVGRLAKPKDFSTLIRAFSIVKPEMKNVKLIILGEGPEREMLEQLIADLGLKNDVYLPGFVDNPYAYMSKADLFVLSSRWEGFGNVIVEAMVCGLPVISTNCPSGPDEIIQDGINGVLVPVRDEQVMANNIVRVLTDNKFGNMLITNAKKRAQDFSIEKITEEYEKIL